MKTCPAVHSFVLEVWLWVYTCTQRLRTLSWPLLEICVLKNQWCVTAKCNYAHEQWWQQFSIWRLPLDLLQMTGAAACFHWLGSLPWSEHKWYRNIIKSVLFDSTYLHVSCKNSLPIWLDWHLHRCALQCVESSQHSQTREPSKPTWPVVSLAGSAGAYRSGFLAGFGSWHLEAEAVRLDRANDSYWFTAKQSFHQECP